MVNIQYTCCLVIDLLLCFCVGGLGFSLHEIGIVLSVVGVLMLPVTLFTFPIVRTTAEKVVMHEYCMHLSTSYWPGSGRL